jgi:hypothetical protein
MPLRLRWCGRAVAPRPRAGGCGERRCSNCTGAGTCHGMLAGSVQPCVVQSMKLISPPSGPLALSPVGYDQPWRTTGTYQIG